MKQKSTLEKSKIDDKIEDSFIKMIFKEKDIGDEMILTAGPSIGSKEKFYSSDATINGWNNEWNKYLKKFENSFAEYIDVKYAIATSSCTGAMQLALMALDIGEGDEVIVPWYLLTPPQLVINILRLVKS